MNSDVLVESVSLRNSYTSRVDVLNKVKGLSLLPDNENVSVEMAAEYYEVSRKTIDSLIFDNRQELESDGLRVLSGDELIFFKEMAIVGNMARSLTVIPRRALLRMGMLLRDSLVAKAVRDYLLNIEQEAPQRAYSSDPDLIHLKREAFMLGFTADMLRLPDSGKLKLLDDFNKQHNFSIPLPKYVEEEVTKSLTALLNEHGVGVPAKAFNLLLIQHGILEDKERTSNRGGSKVFKSLTDEGLEYGKNLISPANPRETQPHYYPDKFAELINRVGLDNEGVEAN